MLEQAVYAGRNHALSLAVVLTLAFALPAQASEIVHVPLGSELGSLVAGPDGGAWIGINRGIAKSAIGRVSPDGSYRTTAAGDYLFSGALGPDGRAWFIGGPGLLLADADGRITTLRVLDAGGFALAAGPDGTMWMTARENHLARVAPDGTLALSPLGVCDHVSASAMARASDGAMWIADNACGLIRRAPDGHTAVVKLPIRATSLAPDASGGVWYASVFEDFDNATAGHVDAAGRITPLKTKVPWTDVAVAPDGSAWFAGLRCKLARAGAGGGFELVRAPIPADQIEFDPAGGRWLASPARLVHDEPAGACDDYPPEFTLNPAHSSNGPPSSRTPRWKSSSSASASGSHSIPSGDDGAIRMRSKPVRDAGS
jgi:streptogramin lyase